MELSDLLLKPVRNVPRCHRAVMLAKMKSLNVCDVLEIGPGEAPLITDLADVPEERKHVIEFPGIIDSSRELGFNCIEQDLAKETWNLPDASVDLVVSSMVLEHIPDTDFVIQEMWRVLRPGGHVLITVPNQGALLYTIMLFLTLNPPMNMVSNNYYGLGNPLSRSRFKRSAEFGTAGYGHLRLFTTRAMNDLLKVYGFKVKYNHGGSWGVPLIGRFLAKLFPYWGLCTIVMAEKKEA